MCLAIPVQVIAILPEQWIEALVGGVRCIVSSALIEPVEVGDYVIVHAGFAIAKLDLVEAEITLALFAQIAAHLKEHEHAIHQRLS